MFYVFSCYVSALHALNMQVARVSAQYMVRVSVCSYLSYMFYVFSCYMSALHAQNMQVARLYAQDMVRESVCLYLSIHVLRV